MSIFYSLDNFILLEISKLTKMDVEMKDAEPSASSVEPEPEKVLKVEAFLCFAWRPLKTHPLPLFYLFLNSSFSPERPNLNPFPNLAFLIFTQSNYLK